MVDQLPHVNAALNLASLVLLGFGSRLARARRIAAHRACMLAALCCSAAFLVSYLFRIGLGGYVTYPGSGWDLWLYRAILGSHATLAAFVPALALRTAWLGLRGDFAPHRRWARVTLPIWLYVSASGLVVYALLFGRVAV